MTGTGQGPLGAAGPGGGEALEVAKPRQETSPPGAGAGTRSGKRSCFLRSLPPPHKIRDV